MKTYMTMFAKKLTETAQLPKRGSAGAAGYDLYSDETITIHPGQRAMISTGIAMAIPEGYYGQVLPRSGLAVKHGIMTMAGVVDSDYRGDIKAVLYNAGSVPYTVTMGDRMAQLVILAHGEFAIVEGALDDTVRGSGRCGSTGV